MVFLLLVYIVCDEGERGDDAAVGDVRLHRRHPGGGGAVRGLDPGHTGYTREYSLGRIIYNIVTKI